MKEILISSSALILALFLLRRLFRRAVSRRLQYALWGLVALRLLIPVSLPAMGFSVLTAASPVTEQLKPQSVYVQPLQETISAPDSVPPQDRAPSPNRPFAVGDASGDNTHTFTDQNNVTHSIQYGKQISVADILRYVWYGGMAVTAAWFLFCNLRFARRLRKARTPYPVEGCPCPVYLVGDGLPSPCLFGLFRPAVYLTPAAAASPETLRHVLAHETTHARHLDSLWALVRCVCLTVYWFDPLVWAAAIASRTDSELACDEGALKTLGAAERVPYGQTLLSLIPVRKGPSSPLLTATTMTSGKKQLKERITRIAENRRTVGIAVFLVLTLTLAACAATFTGAKETEQAAEPLSQAQLTEFQDLLFSREDARIRRQFLSSFYETPEDIDLYELFYNGTGQPETLGDGERQALVDAIYEGQDPEVDLTKCPRAEIEAVLNRYLGCTLAETSDAYTPSNRVGLDDFAYFPEYDAYYHFHGDTNSVFPVTFLSGEREGNFVRLYYDATGMWFGSRFNDFVDGYACLTLEEVPGEAVDGFCYRFVSNQPAELPVQPTVYPEGEPVLTIPLSDSVAVTPQAVEQETISRPPGLVSIARYVLPAQPWEVEVYPAANGEDAFACLINMTDSSSRAYRFLTLDYDVPEDRVDIQPFRNVLGYENGFVLTYRDARNVERTEYYTMDTQKNSLLRLCAYSGFVKAVDLDGDGQKEIYAEPDADMDAPSLLFSRDGEIRLFVIGHIMKSVWPEAEYPEFYYHENERFFYFNAQVPMPDAPEGVTATASRRVFFDGESLLLYKDVYTDGVNTSIDAPAYAITATRDKAEAALAWWNTHTGMESFIDGQWQETGSPASWDGYRITHLQSVEVPAISAQRSEVTAEVYELRYELHTTTPEKVVIAGGAYMDEDGWVGGYNSDDRYLVFLPNGTDAPTLLETHIASDSYPGTPMFTAGIARSLAEAYALHYPEINPRVLAYMFYDNCNSFLNDLGEENKTEQIETLEILCKWALSAGEEDAYYFDQPMENLFNDSSYLTEAGKSAYNDLLDIYAYLQSAPETLPMDPEELLDRFTADPAAFLQDATRANNMQDALALLARYYDTGAADKRKRFSDALHSLRQGYLSAEVTEAYNYLRMDCNLPGPAERDGFDEAGVWNAVNDWAATCADVPGVKSFQLLNQEIDERQTLWYVQTYTASLYANERNYTDDYTSRIVAVQVVFDVTIDPAAVGADAAAADWENGVNACWLYVAPPNGIGPDEHPNEGWFVVDSMSCRVPERYQNGATGLPGAVQPEADFTRYASYDEAYAAVVTAPQAASEAFRVFQELDNGNGYTAVSWGYVGTPHGTDARLSVIAPDGMVIKLDLPPRSELGLADPVENLAFSSDGQTLTYTTTFTDTLITADGSAVVHRAGTYHYTCDIANSTVSLKITPAV